MSGLRILHDKGTVLVLPKYVTDKANRDNTPRQCGTCNLCCRLKGIVELDKPQSQWCPHAERKRGCAIYDKRPLSCREYNCQWLIDLSLPVDHIPSKVGFVCETHAERNRLVITVDTQRPEPPLLQSYIDMGMRNGMTIVVIRDGEATLHAQDIDRETELFMADTVMLQNEAVKAYGGGE